METNRSKPDFGVSNDFCPTVVVASVPRFTDSTRLKIKQLSRIGIPPAKTTTGDFATMIDRTRF